MGSEYDVLIVGARVAGAIVAALLGEAGCSVLLVDRAAFPSPTLSTHFFRGGGLGAVLNRVGVLDKVLALGCPPLLREYLYVGGSEEPLVRPPQNPGELGYGLSVRREWLDQIVLERATSFPSVHLAQRSRIAGLVWDGDRVVGVRIGGKREEQEIRASLVVGADGRHSFVAQAVAAPVEEEEEGHRALYYCYVRDFSSPQGARPDGAEFSVRENEVAYVFPGDQGVTCVAISTGKAEFQRLKAGGLSYFRECIAGHRGIAPRFDAAAMVGRLLGTGPEPNYVRVPAGKGWALVGDAGMHSDPFAGLGMDMAGTHATFLSEAILDCLCANVPEAEAMATYHSRRNEDALEKYNFTVKMSRDLRQMVAQ